MNSLILTLSTLALALTTQGLLLWEESGRERERETEREKESKRESHSECVLVTNRVCVCVCAKERESEGVNRVRRAGDRERATVRGRQV